MGTCELMVCQLWIEHPMVFLASVHHESLLIGFNFIVETLNYANMSRIDY